MFSDYPETTRAMAQLAELIATDTTTVRRGEAKGLNQETIRRAAAQIEEAVPTDDEMAPIAPVDLLVEEGRRQLIVSWAMPPDEDYVVQSVVSTYRVSTDELVMTQYVTGRSVTVPELDPYLPDGDDGETYRVEVAHIDRWGRQGDEATISGDPLISAGDEVDLAALAILGRLRGYLPNENLATLEDAALLGSSIIQARSMVSMDAAAINLWVQNGAIENAKIKNLGADKIAAGVLSVDVELNTGGRIKIKGSGYLDVVTGNPEEQQLVISSSGMAMGGLAKGAAAFPHTSPASWITSLGDNQAPSPPTGIGFFRSEGSPAVRGLKIVAQGVAGTARQGLLRLLANPGSSNESDPDNAGIDIRSGVGGGVVALLRDASAERDFSVGRDLSVLGKLTAEYIVAKPFLIDVAPNGGVATVAHGFGTNRLRVDAYYLEAGNWYPFVHNTNNLRIYIDASVIALGNLATSTRSVRLLVQRTDYPAA